jgi:hypothetical protein
VTRCDTIQLSPWLSLIGSIQYREAPFVGFDFLALHTVALRLCIGIDTRPVSSLVAVTS